MLKSSLSLVALTAVLAAPAVAQTTVLATEDSDAAAQVREAGHDAADAAAEATNSVEAAVSDGVDAARETAADARDEADAALDRLEDDMDRSADLDTDAAVIPANTAGAYLSSAIVGADIYQATVAPSDAGSPAAAVVGTDGMEKIAEVSDILISADGQVIGYLADVGGFLGIGERSVVLSLDSVSPTVIDGDEHALSVAMTREQLEALPEFVEP